ncbi:hypothetical protein QBC33DRAFT_557816 [Phialemonium atrogriseum]|uniref:Uncharacterized protein n=1 Tax=Phialemonium atrogriseum TaxID=1093897 RepID=A0AAJ0C1E4_9PEZI|nr:uncharacterized protein QBC33DRAFT_557816 [Phialemonium atrogriseum]KAK1768353.1 hypothetical protein QBC33DRAFT_557816 [Phialemonium atrogriseum]
MAPSAPMLYSLVLLLGVAAAVPAPRESCEPRTICVDAINTCGVKYGGCYDECNTALKPSPPPCTEATTTTKPTPTCGVPPPVTPITTGDDCSTRTVCWDGVNECGQTYGGCFPDCTPWPTFTPPPCPTITTTTNPVIVTDVPTGVPTICADYINECGKMYGGCFASTSPFPTFSKPPCP